MAGLKGKPGTSGAGIVIKPGKTGRCVPNYYEKIIDRTPNPCVKCKLRDHGKPCKFKKCPLWQK
jgi:hypothetical protein